MKRLRTAAVLLAMAALGLSACGTAIHGGDDTSVSRVGAQAAAARLAATSPDCKDGEPATASIAPDADSGSVGSLSDSKTYQRIKNVNKRLTVGTSADVLLWGAREPKSGQLEGFDVEVLKEIAKRLDVPISYKVITYAQRLPSLADDSVDIVAHTMTINCDRWQGTGSAANAINFSSEYYLAGQRVLVRTDSKATRIESLGGQKVCVPSGSTNVEELGEINQALTKASKPVIDVVEQDVIGDCLVLFQEGEVAAITGDDTVLAGFVAQDPYARIVGPKFTEEPYGLGIKADDVPFTKFVNAVLEDMRSDGQLAKIYRDTMGTAVPGAAPAVPKATYGRDVDALGRS